MVFTRVSDRNKSNSYVIDSQLVVEVQELLRQENSLYVIVQLLGVRS